MVRKREREQKVRKVKEKTAEGGGTARRLCSMDYEFSRANAQKRKKDGAKNVGGTPNKKNTAKWLFETPFGKIPPLSTPLFPVPWSNTWKNGISESASWRIGSNRIGKWPHLLNLIEWHSPSLGHQKGWVSIKITLIQCGGNTEPFSCCQSGPSPGPGTNLQPENPLNLICKNIADGSIWCLPLNSVWANLSVGSLLGKKILSPRPGPSRHDPGVCTWWNMKIFITL